MLDGLDRMPGMTLHVDLSDVSFLDTSGVLPVVDAARRRRDYDWPPLLIANPSRAARRLLAAAGLGPGPVMDIDSWGSADHHRPARAPAGVRCHTRRVEPHRPGNHCHHVGHLLAARHSRTAIAGPL